MKGIQLSCAIVLFAVFSFGAVSAEPAVKKSKTVSVHPLGFSGVMKCPRTAPIKIERQLRACPH